MMNLNEIKEWLETLNAKDFSVSKITEDIIILCYKGSPVGQIGDKELEFLKTKKVKGA